MWSYYGAKTNIVHLYPKPKHDKIIEPFAGTARYSLKYFEKDVLLVDKYEVVIKIWHYLQQASEKDILSLPRKMSHGERFDTINFSCEGERLFYIFLSGCGDAVPRNIATRRKTVERPNHINYNLKRVASNLFKIRHWKIIQSSYELIENEKATWFIDPPYEEGGYIYFESSKNINYRHLSEWSKGRQGQVIVCEKSNACWMDFKPIGEQRGSLNRSVEGIWSNEPTAYDMQQQKLFI